MKKNTIKNIYHSSSIQGMKKITPNKSTHGKHWIYATTTLEMSAVFLSGKGGDLTCQVGRDPETLKVFICERFKNAFRYRYDNCSGSIYLLSKEKFEENKTGWNEEVICEEEVNVIEEITIDDVKDYLLSLIHKGDILFIEYPNKIANIPDDNEDLVERGIVWTRQFGKSELKNFRTLHPNLVARIEKGLSEGKYL